MNPESKDTAPDLSMCDTDPVAIHAEEAHKKIAQTIAPITHTEIVSTRAALRRVAATNIISEVRVPNHTNAAMDGYALRAYDFSAEGSAHLEVIGTSLAGKPFHGEVGERQCVRIMTGAVMPIGTNSVVVQEKVEYSGNTISIPAGTKPGANVRHAGEDLEIGTVAITAGCRLSPAHLGLAVSLGFTELPVLRRPRVAFFSNGDELRPLGKPLQTGELYDSNRYTLYGMLSELGVEMVDMGIVPDNSDAIKRAFQQAATCADVIITSAGASAGEADYVKQTLSQIGDICFWKVAIKPGRPMAFGKLGDSLFFGLPGNPVSVMVTFQVFVAPALQKLAGEAVTKPIRLRAKTLSILKKRPGRTEYQRGILTVDADGTSIVYSTGEQGSGILRSMSEANCFIILPTDSVGVGIGETVEVQPILRY